MFCRLHTKKTEDTDLFERQLNTVLDTDPASLPEIEIESVGTTQSKIALRNMDEISKDAQNSGLFLTGETMIKNNFGYRRMLVLALALTSHNAFAKKS